MRLKSIIWNIIKNDFWLSIYFIFNQGYSESNLSDFEPLLSESS